MQRISLFLLLFIAFSASAQEDGWYHVTTSKDGNDSYSIKLSSGERSQNRKGEPMTVVVGKTADKKQSKIDIFKWYVTDSDCAQEYGNLVALAVDGTYKFDAPFAKGSNNIASSIAETICGVTANEQKKAADKGL